MTTTTDRPLSTTYKVLGTRPIRHDGLDKVTGRAKYGADIQLAGLLHGAVLRSPHAHARIKSIDTSRAEALPGVKAVVIGKDFPEAAAASFVETLGNPVVLSHNMMARDKVLYKGHAVAAVAAATKHIAEEAAALIQVVYEVLPAVLDVRAAMTPGAPVLHEDFSRVMPQARPNAETQPPKTGAATEKRPGNIASHLQLKRGDVQEGFRQADVVVEREFRTKPVHQGYIEPHSSTAWWAPDGGITVWTSTQGPFVVRSQVACILAVPVSQVKVIPMEIGGGFGGKITTYADPVAAVLSRKSGHPVKVVMSRKEVFEATGPTSGSYMRCKIGATREGRLTAIELYVALEAGAYPGAPVAGAMSCAVSLYKVDNLLVDGYDVVLNKPKVAAYRAPGAPLGTLAVETVIDEVAQKLGLDPMLLRRKNAPAQGDRMPSGMLFPRVGGVEVEEAIMLHPHYLARLFPPSFPGKGRGPLSTSPRVGEGGGEALYGRGVAMGYWHNGGMASSATINVNSNGSISLVTGSVDIGGTRASLAMQAAEALGLKAEDVHPSVGDTDSVGWTGVTGGSRTAFATGIAALNAAEDIKRQMIERAALIWETLPGDVEYTDGALVSRKNPQDRLTFKELAGRLMATGGPISASAHADPKGIGPAFAGIIVDVGVDPETGKVDILRATCFQDVGKAAHPSYVEGQMQGGTVQGLGWALNEEYCTNADGVMVNSSFLDYRIPTALDLPMIDTVLIEVPNPGHPYGLRGAGEVPLVPPMAAVANAVSRAIGVRVTDLPLSPGAILKALEGKGKG